MLHPPSKSNDAGSGVKSESYALIERPIRSKATASKRRSLPNNFLLKRLDVLYWKRLLRYLYIRFLRMQGSPAAIARGLAAGAFAGAFPLLGFQTLIGIAIAALFRGNKVMAAVGTWISNPLTYVPLMALNFHVGQWLLRIPDTIVLPTSASGINEWMDLGMSAMAAMMVGSLLVGTIVSILAYYLGLAIAHRARAAKAKK
ncbi:MAG: DUF2062 domain-containing protein [Phormidesmis sp.]